MQLRRLLYPVDFSSATHHGLEAAVSMARTFGAELLLAHIIDFPYPYMNQVALSFDLDRYYRETEDAAKARLETLAKESAPDLSCSTVVLRGGPATGIVDLVADKNIDLVVMPTHARTGFERMLVGSITEKVVRMSPCPVLTITPTEEPAGPLEIKSILFPTDFSDRSDQPLADVLGLAEQVGASVLMLHVVTIGDEDPANPDWGFPVIPEEHVASAMQVAEERLASRVSDNGKVAVATKLVRGFDPAYEICRVADEEDVDLVAMATHGHTGLLRALLGSTAGKVIRHHDGPVLSFRSPG